MRSQTRQEERSGRRGPGGRPTGVVAAVHAATMALLQEQGYERMEIPGIAERAGVNKTSIYRRWPSKAELVFEAVLARTRNDIPLPDTGSLQGDLTAFMRAIAASLSTPFVAGLVRAVISRQHEKGMAEARERFWKERQGTIGELVQKAIAREEIPATTNGRLVLEMAAAPVYFRALVMGTALTDAEIETISERITIAFGTAPDGPNASPGHLRRKT